MDSASIICVLAGKLLAEAERDSGAGVVLLRLGILR
jgi:hypothetical protein